MLEHICHKNDQVSFLIRSQRIKPHGLAWIQSVSSNDTNPYLDRSADAYRFFWWSERYSFGRGFSVEKKFMPNLF